MALKTANQNIIKSLLINDEETPYPFDSLELINYKHQIKAVLSDCFKSKTIKMKFQRGFHPQKIKTTFYFENKDCLTESVSLKANNDLFVLDVPEHEGKLIEVLFCINNTYDHFNRLVIYELVVV